MTARIKISDRLRDFAIAILAALAALWLSGCDGAGGAGETDAGGGARLLRSDAGVTYCEIPSPSGDVVYTNSDGSKSTHTMREVYSQAALAGAPGYWGMVDNLSELVSLCKASKAYTVGACEASLADHVKYCFYADYRWDAAGNRVVYHFGSDGLVLGEWDGDSRRVYAALCTLEGVFAGWICAQ